MDKQPARKELTPEEEHEGVLLRIKHWEIQLEYSRHAVEVAERSLEALYKERDESVATQDPKLEPDTISTP